jgi:hypothetical protein
VAGAGAATLFHEADQFKRAKQDAFDSINALTRARAISYDANADESRWLLDRNAALQGGFFAKASQIAAVPGVDGPSAAADPRSYYDGLASAVSRPSGGTSPSGKGPATAGTSPLGRPYRLDHARPAQRPRPRMPASPLRGPHQLDRHHPDDQATDPRKEDRPAAWMIHTPGTCPR